MLARIFSKGRRKFSNISAVLCGFERASGTSVREKEIGGGGIGRRWGCGLPDRHAGQVARQAAQEPLDAALPAGAAGMLAESAAEEPAASIAGAPATRIPVVPLDEHAGLNHAAWGRGGLGPPPPIPSRLLILRA